MHSTLCVHAFSQHCQNISKIAKSQDPATIVLTSALSEIFLRKLAKQGFIRYTEGSEFVDTREDLIEAGDATGGGLKEMDEKLKTYEHRCHTSWSSFSLLVC